MNWIDGFGDIGSWYKARLYETIRTFSRYACVVDPESFMLPKGMCGCHGRTNPYIYTDEEAALMMNELAAVHSPDGLRAKSLSCMFGLMYSCGLRPSECIRLTIQDYDSGSGSITILNSKFNRSRIVPLSDSAAAAIELQIAALAARPAKRNALFQRTGGIPFDIRAVEYGWKITRDALLPPGSASWDRRPPRPYDCRHSFCTHTIERWLGERSDINALMPLLSIYVGHRKVADTYWYLAATELLLDSAADAFWTWVEGESHEKRC